MKTTPSTYLRASDLARLLGITEGHGLYVPKLEAIAVAMGLALDALEDRTDARWHAHGVRVGKHTLGLYFRLDAEDATAPG